MLETLGFSVWQIGLLFSIVPLVRFITPFVFKKILNINSNIIQISIFLNLIACVLYYFTLQSFALLSITIFIYAISLIQFLPFCESIAMRSFTKEEYGKIRLFGSLGFIVIALIVPYTQIYF